MKKLVYLLSAIVLTACTTPTWSEEFSGNELDTAVWSKIPRGTVDWNRFMSDTVPGLVEIRDGSLHLYGIVDPEDSSRVVTGGIWTREKKTFGYGRLEVRARIGSAKGAWPAIWMTPAWETKDDDPFWQQFNWKKYAEIDICERLNYDTIAYQTLHSTYTLTSGEYGIKEHLQKSGSTGVIDTAGFNVYAVEHYQDSIKFFINGVNTLCYKKLSQPETDTIPLRAQWTFDTPFNLYLDMQLGGSWVGEVDRNDLPVEMEIDWVRFYQF